MFVSFMFQNVYNYSLLNFNIQFIFLKKGGCYIQIIRNELV